MKPKAFWSCAACSLLLVTVAAGPACTSSCDKEDRTLVITSGRVTTTRVDGSTTSSSVQELLGAAGADSGAESEAGVLLRVYESSPWGGPLARFEGGNTLEFEHGLGVVPEWVSTYLSFAAEGTDKSNVAENAGDSGLIECVDAEIIRLRNNTCENEYSVRVLAQATQQGSQSSQPCRTE
ncbi:MAG TPA: hypothetical protein VFQ61_22545 [Polyangiaceae bacterium]|nr:hypothetical protein [Polyangiaceae bacterium]